MPVSRFCLLVLIGVLSLTSLALTQSPALHGGVMLDCSGLPCVDVTLQTGQHLRLLVDTGNVSSIVDAAIARKLNLDVSPVKGQDGKPVAGYGRALLSDAKIGDGNLGDVKVLVLDLSEDIKRGHLPASDGTIAYTAFKDRILQLDYIRRRIEFSAALTVETPCRRKCGDITLPTFGKEGPPSS